MLLKKRSKVVRVYCCIYIESLTPFVLKRLEKMSWFSLTWNMADPHMWLQFCMSLHLQRNLIQNEGMYRLIVWFTID